MDILFDLLIFAGALYAWIRMMTYTGKIELGDMGIRSMKYFTILSNLYAGLVCGILAVLRINGKAALPLSMVWSVFLFTAVVSISLTFWVVVLHLVRLYGFGPMFAGVNLILHGMVPVFTMICFAFTPLAQLPFYTIAYTLIPIILYGLEYALNILKNGINPGPDTNDWYGFTRGDIKNIWPAFAGVVFFTFIIAFVTWLFRFKVLM